MEFKILKTRGSLNTKTFDTLQEAKMFLHIFIKERITHNFIVGFIKKSLDKYVIYYTILESPRFIDDIIDYINQWQYERDSYIECVILPYYENILTIEINY